MNEGAILLGSMYDVRQPRCDSMKYASLSTCFGGRYYLTVKLDFGEEVGEAGIVGVCCAERTAFAIGRVIA